MLHKGAPVMPTLPIPLVLPAVVVCIVIACLIGCSPSPPPAGNTQNPLDQFLDPNALALQGFSSATFNPQFSPLRFALASSQFLQDADEVLLSVNGNTISSSQVTVQPDTILVDAALVDGKNDIVLSAADAIGRPLHYRTTLWAGNHTLHVTVLDENGHTLSESADVVASLADDLSVFARASTVNGTVQFENVPDRTLVIEATASGNRRGLAGAVGSQVSAQVRLRGFNPPSAINNNDFSLGTNGWDIGTAPVKIVPHVEPRPVPIPPGTTLVAQSGQVPAVSLAVAAADQTDNDLELATSGEGEQSVSRTFETQPGTTAVEIRYAFVTSEVPGGFFGSKYDDYFSVSLRSEQGGGSASEENSMNGLGLEAFDSGGATEFRKVILPVDKQGDTIQADVTVANVADAKYDSGVVVALVREIRDQVKPSLAWNSADGGMDLNYEVVDGELANDVTIDVYWASGPAYENRLGAAIFSQDVPKGTPEGKHGPVHIAGDQLADDPDGVTHLIAAASETSVGALPDVKINYGANADATAVSAGMIDIIKDGMRAAGTATASIQSTARTPHDQARAMFNNLVNPTNSVDVNVANQHQLYAAPGDAVIDVFSNETQGMTRDQIVADQGPVRDAMEQEINNQGPTSVSHHCADPAQVSVVDVLAGDFVNGALFVSSVQGRVSNFIDESGTNGCYHLELQH